MSSDFLIPAGVAPEVMTSQEPPLSELWGVPIQALAVSTDQQPAIEILGSSITVPLRHKIPFKEFDYRKGAEIDNQTITRFDPLSLEFDSSINVGPFPSNDSPAFHRKGELLPTGFSLLSNSEFFRRKVDAVKAFFRLVKIENQILNSPLKMGLTDIDRIKYTGRSVLRYDEKFFEVTGVGTLKEVIEYFRVSIIAASTNDAFGDEPLISRDCQDRSLNPADAGLNRLINVYEDRVNSNFCLSFVKIVHNLQYLYHIWYRPSNKALRIPADRLNLDPITLGEILDCPPYLMGGLPRLVKDIFLAGAKVDPKTGNFNVNAEGYVFPVNFYDSGLLGNASVPKFHTWPMTHTKFVDSLVMCPEFSSALFGIEFSADVSTEALKIENHPLNGVEGFNEVRSCIIHYINTSTLAVKHYVKNKEAISSNFFGIYDTSRSFRAAIIAGISKTKSQIISQKISAMENPTYEKVVQFLSEPEFRKNLNV